MEYGILRDTNERRTPLAYMLQEIRIDLTLCIVHIYQVIRTMLFGVRCSFQDKSCVNMALKWWSTIAIRQMPTYANQAGVNSFRLNSTSLCSPCVLYFWAPAVRHWIATIAFYDAGMLWMGNDMRWTLTFSHYIDVCRLFLCLLLYYYAMGMFAK